MKKVIVTLLTALTTLAATAQINKGTWLIGTSSNLGVNSISYKGSSDKTAVFNISLKGGYFVAKNLVVGLNTGYTTFTNSASGSPSNTQTTTIIGAFGRYYLPKNFFIGAGINSVSNTYDEGADHESHTSTALPFEFGFAAFITKNVAIEPSINYVKGDDKGGVTYAGLVVGGTSSIGFNLGLTVYLNRN